MARSLYPNCFLQEFDNSGNPLNAGTITFYVADQAYTTKKDTYVSSSGSANANPVVLDYAGRAQIWLDGTYDVRIADSAGNIIATRNNISGLGGGTSGTSANFYKVDSIAALRLLHSTDYTDGDIFYVGGYYSDYVGGGGWFVWDDDNVTADDYGTIIMSHDTLAGRWVRYMNETFKSLSFRDFGAKGDASTDDATAFTRAQAWVTANAGASLVLSQGTYVLASAPAVTAAIRFMPNAKIDTSAVTSETTFTWTAVIDPSDMTQHFNPHANNTIVLNGTQIVRPEHFGYTSGAAAAVKNKAMDFALACCANSATYLSNMTVALAYDSDASHYSFTSTKTIPAYVTLDGNNSAMTIALGSSATHAIQVSSHASVKNLSLVVTGSSNSAGLAGINVVGEAAEGVGHISCLENVKVDTAATTAHYGIIVGTSGGTTLCVGATIKNCDVTSRNYGLWIASAKRCFVIGGHYYETLWAGIRNDGVNTVIDGVKVFGANSAGDTTDNYKMAAIYNDGAYATIRNCLFGDNVAAETQKYSICNSDETGTLILENLHTAYLVSGGTAYYGDSAAATLIRGVDSCTAASGITRTNFIFALSNSTDLKLNLGTDYLQFGKNSTEGMKITVYDENITLTAESSHVVTAISGLVLMTQMNIETLVTGAGGLAAVNLGLTADHDKYGTSALTKNTKSSRILSTWEVIDENFVLYPDAGTFTGGVVRVRIVYINGTNLVDAA